MNQTEYRGKWLEFYRQVRPPNRKTDVWTVTNHTNDQYLGVIQWDTGWRAYVFVDDGGAYDPLKLGASCLFDLGNFINELMEERK